MVKEQNDQYMKDNQGINIDEIVSEVTISCGKNLYENILNSKKKKCSDGNGKCACTIRANALEKQGSYIQK
jgi:hypothetical protein